MDVFNQNHAKETISDSLNSVIPDSVLFYRFLSFKRTSSYFDFFPCSREFNGFHFHSIPTTSSNHPNSFVWACKPLGSKSIFFFRSFFHASKFFKQFKNNHSDRFWSLRWSPIYSYKSAVKLHSKVDL